MEVLEAFLLDYEAAIRLTFFLGVLAAMAAWEVFAPRRTPAPIKGARWRNNLALLAVDVVAVRLVFPAAAVGVAAAASQLGWGWFNYVDAPVWLAVVASVVALDLVIYLQHVMFHAVPAFWRLHRVHHVDLDFDVTTGVRFHPVEILLSMLIKAAAIVTLGAPVAAVIVFEVLLNATSMFNHGNVRMPHALDRLLRAFIVTPDMHRVHHSVLENETNSNFGFNLSIWDRLLGTYRPQPREGHQGMTIGLHQPREPQTCVPLPSLLLLPFREPVTGYAINRRRWKDDA